MIIGILGGGVVGHATARAFIEHVDEVRVYDTRAERCTHSLEQIVMAGACGLDKPDLVFICLPETKIEVPFLANMPYGWDRNLNYVLKSTVPIGTTRRLCEQFQLPEIVHSPEFLTARCAVTDAQLPARNIIGIPGSKSSRQWCITSDEGEEPILRTGAEPLQILLLSRFPGIPVYVMSSDESEAVKLFQNGIFAVTVSLWNELYTLATKLELNWDKVREAILADGRISLSHTLVPGPDGKYGFGGTCLPKDLIALITEFSNQELPARMCSAAYNRNTLDRERE